MTRAPFVSTSVRNIYRRSLQQQLYVVIQNRTYPSLLSLVLSQKRTPRAYFISRRVCGLYSFFSDPPRTSHTLFPFPASLPCSIPTVFSSPTAASPPLSLLLLLLNMFRRAREIGVATKQEHSAQITTRTQNAATQRNHLVVCGRESNWKN